MKVAKTSFDRAKLMRCWKSEWIQLLLTLTLHKWQQRQRLAHTSTNLHQRVTQSVHFKISAKSSEKNDSAHEGVWECSGSGSGLARERGVENLRNSKRNWWGRRKIGGARASAGNCQLPNEWANVSGGNASSLIVRRQETPINSFRLLSRLTSCFLLEFLACLRLSSGKMPLTRSLGRC